MQLRDYGLPDALLQRLANAGYTTPDSIKRAGKALVLAFGDREARLVVDMVCARDKADAYKANLTRRAVDETVTEKPKRKKATRRKS